MILASTFDVADGIMLAVVVLLIGGSALFALAETSLVRMSRARAKALEDEGHLGAKSLRRLAEDPDRFLNPVLLLVLLCQLVAATLVGVVTGALFGPWGVAAATAFEVVIIFVFGEAVPKNWAVRHSARAALVAAPLVTTLIRFPPLRWVTRALVGFSSIFSLGAIEGGHGDVTESELLAMADVAATDEVIETEERALIHSIIDFGDTIVREVMVPRPDVVAVPATMEAVDALDRATDAGFSRLPVYVADLDDVAGIAFTKDLIRAVREGREHRPVGELARPAHFVPETKRVAPLMREMQAEQYHMAIVIDEYGGTAGAVTLEDLIEELVGEIVDEFDVAEQPLVEALPGGGYRVSSRVSLDEVNDLLGTELPEGDWDTIGGLVMALLGHVPTEGESVVADSHILVAERMKGRRIGRVRIVPHRDELTGGTDGGAGWDAGAGARLPARLGLPGEGGAGQGRAGAGVAGEGLAGTIAEAPAAADQAGEAADARPNGRSRRAPDPARGGDGG